MANFGKLDFSTSFAPSSAFPLDSRYYFDSYEAAEAAAASAAEVGSADSVYFFGENVVVVEDGTATIYVIQPNNTLSPIGSAALGDNKSIVVEDNIVKLYGFDGATAGQQPRKKSDGTIEWYTPDTSSVSGLQEAVGQLQSDVAGLKTGKVNAVTAGDNSVTIGGTATDPTVAVKIDPEEGNLLTSGESGLKVKAPEYTIEKEADATEGYLATYVLKKDGVQAGQKIDIPKDYLVKSASIKTSSGEEDPSGFPDGTKYIDFVINTVGSDGTESHIYLNVEDIAVAYTAGNGIDISEGNAISAKVVAENGLSVNASGIKLAVASQSTAGAMSAEDKKKLDGIDASSLENYVKSVAAPVTVSPEGELSVPEASGASAGLMSAADKTKLDNVKEVTQSETNGNITVGEEEITVYTLPVATNAVIGGVKVDGSTIQAVSGTISVLKTPNALTAGGKTFDGSAAVTITAGDLDAYTKSEVDGMLNESLSWNVLV